MTLIQVSGALSTGQVKVDGNNLMSLSESQRQHCLETMGVQSYFPRFILPDAKESTQCHRLDEMSASQEVEAAPPIPQEMLETSTPVPEKVRPSLVVNRVVKENDKKDDKENEARPASDLRSKPEPSEIQKPEPAKIMVAGTTNDTVSEIKEVSTELVRFQLAFIRVNESICILNQIPTIGSNRLSHSHQALLINMLTSLQQNTEQIQFGDMPFRWPMIEGEHIDNSQGAARKALHSFLEQKQSDGQFRSLWVMGELAEAFVEREQDLWQIIGTRSLDEMLNFPQLKRDVWRQLRLLPFPSVA